MADTLKFGPQWLRALSDGNSVSSPPASPGFPAPGMPKYKLAEHRYGREEMLALFVPNTKVPEPLLEIPSIVVEKALHPLAFIPPAEEEQRLLSNSVNSPAVLRLMGRGTSFGDRGRGERGRGSGGERGRGRGRGRGEGYYRPNFEEEGFGRGRHVRGESWEESAERPRFERGSFSGRSFDEGPPSPRREYSRSMSSDNWREAKREAAAAAAAGGGGGGGVAEPTVEEDSGDWRRAGPKDRWPAARSSWREPKERGFEEGFQDFGHSRSYRRTNSGSWNDSHPGKDLPEWSTANFDDCEDIGTFDSSGAFMSLKEAEEQMYRDVKESKSKDVLRKSSSPMTEKDREKEDSPQKSPRESAKALSERQNRDKENSPRPDTNKGSQPVKESPASVNHGSGEKKQKQTSVNSSVGAPPAESPRVNNKRDSGKKAPVNGDVGGERVPKHASSKQSPKPVNKNQPQSEDEQLDIGHLELENMVATWTAEEDAKQDKKDVVESGAVPSHHEDAQRWFYKDPQGDLQGPFTSAEMSEWFSAGYFTMNLLVKRGCDDTFHNLGELIKRWGKVPFHPGFAAAPIKVVSSGEAMPPTSGGQMPGMIPPVSAGAPPVSMPMGGPNVPIPADPQQQEQMMKMQQQQALMMQQQMMQQHALLQQRQFHLQQILQNLQQQEAFQKLPAQQQQQIAVTLLMKQQQAAMQQGQGQGQPKLSPRSPTNEQATAGGPPAFQRSMSQPGEPTQPSFPRSVSQPAGLEEAPPQVWGAGGQANQVPTSAGGWTAGSVWDVETPKTTPSMEEIQQMEIERLRRDQEQREMEIRRQQEDEMRRREEEIRKRKEMEEMERLQQEAEERRRELERQELERLERERLKELERQREMERRQEMERMRLEQQQAEQRRRHQEEEERRREEERKRIEDERRRIEEMRREEERRRQQEIEELEKKRAEEIRRRQVLAANEKAEEMRRLEMVRRLQEQQQLANMQLPASAQWADNKPQNSSGLSLAEIQEREAERERQEQEERKVKMEIQRQQLAAIQQQQQKLTWAGGQPRPITGSSKSLLEIQQEQERQDQDQMRQHHVNATQRKQQVATVPLQTAAVWGGASSTWASDGAWGNPQTKANLGFWDEQPQQVHTNKKTPPPTNTSFPALHTPVANHEVQVNKSRSKAKKEEETVQRLFQSMKPKDEFTQWCENALKGMQSSVDVPTFVAFLTDVESPFEVSDYVCSYLGETKEARDFAKQFVEKRSKYKNQLKQQQQEESMWGPAPAITPGQPHARQQVAAGAANNAVAEEQRGALPRADKAIKKDKKKKMQKLDAGILGFTVHAAPDRMVGEIDSLE